VAPDYELIAYMPFRYTIDKNRQLVVSRGSGVLTKNELLSYRHQLRSDPNFDESFWRLIDLTEVTDIQVSADEISFLAQLNTGSPQARRAIVANRALFNRLARMYEVMEQKLGGQVELTQVFADLPSAERWLGLDEPPRST